MITAAIGNILDKSAKDEAAAKAVNALSATLPAFETLRERLARPANPTRWRIEGILPAGARVIFSAQFKSGKTTAVSNLVQSFVDDLPMFGVFPVVPRPGSVVVGLDFEMHPDQLDRWYRHLRIYNDDRAILVPMRGVASSFNIVDPANRAAWAAKFRAVGTTDLVVDCLRPVLDALGLDENKETGFILAALDALVKEAGIENLIVPHHMGHNGERSRGESRLRDWPDVEWTIVRKSDDPASPRYFKAYGRDVDVPEGQLAFDPDTRRLTLVGGSRQDAKHDVVIDSIIEVVTAATEPMTGLAIKGKLVNVHGRNQIDEALSRAATSGRLRVVAGPHNAKFYSIPPASQFPADSRQLPGNPVSQFPCFPLSYKERETGKLTTGQEETREVL